MSETMPAAPGQGPFRYTSADEDSGRWAGFPFRNGDIVISTRSKSGTTWVQMICALLIFQTSELPGPLAELSPWLDWLVTPQSDAFRHLAAQEHRRFIKTHTPLDGLPLDPRATYLVVARHPLDMAVSLYHHRDNLDRARISELTGIPRRPGSPDAQPPLGEWLAAWIDADVDPRAELDSLAGVMWHLSDAWSRRHEPNVVLLHYDDLLESLDAQMRRVARHLGIAPPDALWPELVAAASFERMQARADVLAPGPSGVLKKPDRFFRRGTSGAATEVLSTEELERYHTRAARLAPADLLEWLHRGSARPPY